MSEGAASGISRAFSATSAPLWRRVALAAVSLLIAAAVWIPCVHLFFAPDADDYFAPDGIPPVARALAKRHLAFWADRALHAEELKKMRGSNPEWDFMGRTFLVLALTNMGLREPAAKDQYLAAVDRIIDNTLRLEKERGFRFFLMDYAHGAAFVSQPARSLFVDSEIALMLGARRLVEEKPEYKPLLTDRVNTMARYMRKSPVLCAESYPDECWMFDNVVALAALRIADVLDGTDHSEFINAWLDTAKRKLVDGKTGLLISSCMFDGYHKDGPEGSTIWLVAHCLQLLDPALARDQYRRARSLLGRSVLGFSYAREWPPSWRGPADIDSGPVIPVLGASPGSSGLAILGAAAFGDREFLSQLITSLEVAAFPSETRDGLKYCASNQVGDAVLLYSTTLGPLWKKVKAAYKQ